MSIPGAALWGNVWMLSYVKEILYWCILYWCDLFDHNFFFAENPNKQTVSYALVLNVDFAVSGTIAKVTIIVSAPFYTETLTCLLLSAI